MTYEDLILKEAIMRRVRFIHALKTLAVPLATKLSAAAALAMFAAFFVSLPDVVHNMPSVFEVSHFAKFALTAFLKTRIVIQVASLAMFALVFGMTADIVRVFREPGVFSAVRR